MRDEVFLLGRILFSLLFISSGIGHLTQTDGMAGYASSRGLPNAKTLVQVSGVLMLLGAAGVILGIWLDLAGLLLAVLAVVIAVAMHSFWKESDPQSKQMEMVQFLKNLSIAGGGLIIAAVSKYAPYTITDGVF